MTNSDGNTKEDLIRLISDDIFAGSYFHAAMVLTNDDDGDEEGDPLLYDYTMHDVDITALQRIWDNCVGFKQLGSEWIEDDQYYHTLGWQKAYDMAGSDFFLTSAGLGAGFWDGDWPSHGDELTELADTFKALELYVGDDGAIYALGAEQGRTSGE